MKGIWDIQISLGRKIKLFEKEAVQLDTYPSISN